MTLSAEQIVNRYPDRVPVLAINPDFNLKKNKFLVPRDLQFGMLLSVFRRRMEVDVNVNVNGNVLLPEEALFVRIHKNNERPISPPLTELMGNLYLKYSSNDQFLRMSISRESVFG